MINCILPKKLKFFYSFKDTTEKIRIQPWNGIKYTHYICIKELISRVYKENYTSIRQKIYNAIKCVRMSVKTQSYQSVLN